MAAANSPIMGIIFIVSCWVISSCMLIDDVVISQAVVMIRPISPMRL